MTPKRFDLMSDLEKMAMEDIAFYHSEYGKKALLFNTKDEIGSSKDYLSHNTIEYSKAVTDYWNNYFKAYRNDERP
jgi:hypothetical protein